MRSKCSAAIPWLLYEARNTNSPVGLPTGERDPNLDLQVSATPFDGISIITLPTQISAEGVEVLATDWIEGPKSDATEEALNVGIVNLAPRFSFPFPHLVQYAFAVFLEVGEVCTENRW